MVSDESILKKLAEEGLHLRVVSVDHLEQLKADLSSLREKGTIDKGLWKRYLSGFKFQVPAELRDASHIVVAAVPQSSYTVAFTWKGRRVSTIVPPTYLGGQEVIDDVRERLTSSFGSGRYKFVYARLPMKTLATRSGLAKYGRNNITYVEGLGSFHRLAAFFTNYPFKVDQWQEREAMPKCDKCKSCRRACPTGAISEDRFQLHAERCLVYLNEMPPSRKFPDWVKPEWHNALIGCMICQRACPYDVKAIHWTEALGEFDEDETRILLSGTTKGKRASAIRRKARKMGLDVKSFPRNLTPLLS